MSFILEVQAGPRRGATIPLAPGSPVRVGRTAKADEAFPDDSHMSGAHFSVERREDGCFLRDLGSSNGTHLNGKPIVESILQLGDRITAGETEFLFCRLEDITAPLDALPVSVADEPAPELTIHDRLLQLFRNDFQPLYAILDAARDIRILALLLNCKERENGMVQSLYEGPQADKLAQVAPYLVRLEPDSALLESLVREGWGKSWGVYLTCPDEFAALRRHLRRFLEVKLPDGEQVYFRFYDPRVLRVFLPTCTPDETAQFFGAVQGYAAEDDCPETLLHLTAARGTASLRRTSFGGDPQRDPDDTQVGERTGV